MATLAPLTLATLRAQTRQQVGDPVRYAVDGVTVLAGPQTWTDSQVNEAVNWACLNLASKLELTLVESPASVDATGHITAPTEAIKIKELAGTDANKYPLLDTSAEFEGLRDPAWRSRVTGTPMRCIAETPEVWRVIPGTPGTSLTVRYVECPTALAADGDLPDTRIPAELHPALQFAAASYLLIQAAGDGESAGDAQAKMQVFNGLIHYRDPQDEADARAARSARRQAYLAGGGNV